MIVVFRYYFVLKKYYIGFIFMRLFGVFFGVVCASLSLSGTVFAQTLTRIQDVDFGLAVVTNNNAQYEVVVSPGGGFSHDPEIAFITNPTSGSYRLTGAAPGQTIDSVTFTIDQQMIGPGEDFILDNFNATFPATADGAGQAIINIGGRMQTTGNFTNYDASSAFSGMVTIEVNLL